MNLADLGKIKSGWGIKPKIVPLPNSCAKIHQFSTNLGTAKRRLKRRILRLLSPGFNPIIEDLRQWNCDFSGFHLPTRFERVTPFKALVAHGLIRRTEPK